MGKDESKQLIIKQNKSLSCLSKALGTQGFWESPVRTYLPVDWSEPSVVGLEEEPWDQNSEGKKKRRGDCDKIITKGLLTPDHHTLPHESLPQTVATICKPRCIECL